MPTVFSSSLVLFEVAGGPTRHTSKLTIPAAVNKQGQNPQKIDRESTQNGRKIHAKRAQDPRKIHAKSTQNGRKIHAKRAQNPRKTGAKPTQNPRKFHAKSTEGAQASH
jgi:ribosomal protein L34